MARYAHILAAIAISAVGCNVRINGVKIGRGLPGSGVVVTDHRELPSFTKIEYGGSGHINVIQGNSSQVDVTCDDNLQEFITTEVHGDTLRIKSTRSINPSGDFSFDVTCSDLQRLSLSGSGSAKVAESHTPVLEIQLTGSGSVSLQDAHCDTLEVNVMGSGSVKGAGKTESLKIMATGSGSVSLQELQAQTVTASITGSGSAKVYASESCNASSTGSGSITCYGNPSSRQQASTGSGAVQFRD